MVDMTTAAATTAITPPDSIDLVEDVAAAAAAIAGGKNERPSLLKKMDGFLNDYAGNGGGTATFGGEIEKK